MITRKDFKIIKIGLCMTQILLGTLIIFEIINIYHEYLEHF